MKIHIRFLTNGKISCERAYPTYGYAARYVREWLAYNGNPVRGAGIAVKYGEFGEWRTLLPDEDLSPCGIQTRMQI